MMRILSITLILFSLTSSLNAKANFNWQKKEGTHIDLILGEKKIARYVFERMNPNDRERTYKPFYHLYDSTGTKFITKGPGGRYTHHRGIYFGFSKCSALDGQGKPVSVDTWHCKRGYQIHERTLSLKAGHKKAALESEITWRVDDGTIFITERRKLAFSFLPNQLLQIDFDSILSTKQPVVNLDGDPQHAGFQFRASNEVAEKNAKATYYIRPNEGKDEMGKTKNWPQNKDMQNQAWKGQSVIIGEQRYYTLYLDHPSNPKPSYYSERDYGRFGSYFKAKVTPEQPLRVRYRLISGTEELDANQCDSFSAEFISK
jgi:hypothetical protein